MKHILKFILLVLLSLAGIGKNIYAQKMGGLQGQQAIDSFLKVINTGKYKNDSEKAQIYITVCSLYPNINADEGIKYGQMALEQATKLNWKNAMVRSNLNLGANYHNKSDYPKALDHFLKSLKLSEEIGFKPGIINSTANLGAIYAFQKDFQKALEYYFMTLKISEEVSNKIGIATASGNIGSIYQVQNEYAKAMEYLNKALKVSEETGHVVFIAKFTVALGTNYARQKNYSLALDYLLKALKLNKDIGDTYTVAQVLEDIGSTYYDIATDSIPANLHQAAPVTVIPAGKAAVVEKAIDYFQQSLAISRELNAMELMLENYKALANAYKLSGNYKMAIEYTEKFHSIQDSIYSNDNTVKIAKLETKREADLKEKQISINKLESIKKRNERIIFSIGLGFLLLLVSGLFFNLNFVRKSRKAIQKEKDISEGLLLNILPAEVAQELKVKGYSDAKHFDQATVLFTDFKGFTQMSEKLSPAQLVAELDHCFKGFDEIMHKYGIEKIKTIGDSYMAVGGLPDPSSCTPDKVVQAALEMTAFILKRKADKEKEGMLSFEMRVGIHTGPVVAGIVGIKKFQYDIWGDTVNTASRMESSGEVGKVNISGTTYELVKDKFTCQYRGKVSAKGKGEVDMYFVS